MDRIVITICPTPSDEGLLRVADAMQQVIDAIKLLDHAERALISPQESFEWRLERASTRSQFTVVAVAEPINPIIDVTMQVRHVKAEVSRGLHDFIVHGQPPTWMDKDSIKIVKDIFFRNQNGIGRTDIDFEVEGNPGDILAIDRDQANAGIRAISALNLLDDIDLPERESFGEIEGVMVAAGRYRNRPAIQIRSELYGFVWCPLTNSVINKFGTEHSVADVWRGKTIAVHGRLGYAIGGMLRRVEVSDIREVRAALPIDLDSVLDSDFTSGLDPHEYLTKLHEGELA